MSERRRPTRGERGARPDPLNSGLYCRHCQTKYCSCDGFGNQEDFSWLYDMPPGDPGANDPWGTAPESPESEPSESETAESKGWTTTDTVMTGVGLAGAGAIVGGLGFVVGVPVLAGLAIGGFAIGALFSKRS